MARPKKMDTNGEHRRTKAVKKTIEVDYKVDRYLKVMVSLEGLSDAEYVRNIIEKSISSEVKDMVDKK